MKLILWCLTFSYMLMSPLMTYKENWVGVAILTFLFTITICTLGIIEAIEGRK